MNKEEREQIISNNNIASDQLKNYLEGSTKPLQKVHISYALFGDVDFAVLKELNMGVPKDIILEEGKITSILNLPEGVETIRIQKNMLYEVKDLPKSLQVLDLEENYIQNIDLTNLSNLKELNVSHNQLHEISNFPGSLTSINVSHNKLKMIDMKDIDNLEYLNVSNNMITLIENFPENGIPEFIMENTPSIEFRGNIPDAQSDKRKEKTKKMNDFKKALSSYFKLKSKYEKKIKELKKQAFKKADSRKKGKIAAQNIQPQCIKCKRKVGTIFQKTPNSYLAICGDTESPCNLQIKIFTGNYEHYEKELYFYHETQENSKSKIIEEKMNNIFSYSSDNDAKQLYEKHLEDFNLEKELLDEMLDLHKELFHNKSKKQEIIEKEQKIFEIQQSNLELLEDYKKTSNKEMLKQIVKNNMYELEPLFKKITQLKYEIQEVNYDESDDIYKVFNYPVHFDKMEVNIEEDQEVKEFNI